MNIYEINLFMHHKIPVKLLIKESGRMFAYFIIGALLITSLQDFDLNNLLYKAISLSTLLTFIFFANTYVLYYFDKKRKSLSEKIWRKAYAVGYLSSLFFFFIHHFFIQYFQQKGYIVIPQDIKQFTGWRLIVFIVYANFVVYSFVFFIQNFILHQYEKSRIQLELMQLKSSNADTTNQLLKQQIQPHFLFNALNTLKSLIKKRPDTAEDYLIRLSDFLRASFSHKPSGLSTVAEELTICNNYMEMQKIRFGDSINYRVDIADTDPDLQHLLPVFSLQPLLENAIKHNIATIENPLTIKIVKENNYIMVSNNLQFKNSMETSTGNGLVNLKERYKILSEDEVIINNDNHTFSVKIKILRNEHRNN